MDELKIVREYKAQYKELERYKNNAARLDADAHKYAQLLYNIEKQTADHKEAEQQKTIANTMRITELELKELELRAKGKTIAADEVAKEIERLKLINDYKERYKEAEQYKGNTVKLEEDAMKYARARAGLETKISKEAREQERIKKRIADSENLIYRLQIARAKLEGDSKRLAMLEAQQAKQKEIQSLIENGWDKKAAEKAVAAVHKMEEAAEKAAAALGGTSTTPATGSGARPLTQSNASSTSGAPSAGEGRAYIGPAAPTKGTRAVSKARAAAEARGEKFDSANFVPEYNKPQGPQKPRIPSPNQFAAQAKQLEAASRAQPADAQQTAPNATAQTATPPDQSISAPGAQSDAQKPGQENAPANKSDESNQAASSGEKDTAVTDLLSGIKDVLEGHAEQLTAISTILDERVPEKDVYGDITKTLLESKSSAVAAVSKLGEILTETKSISTSKASK